MNRSLALLPALAALAVPGLAHADMIRCTDDDTGLDQPCTMTVDTSGGVKLSVPSGKVITAYTGTFDGNASVGLRLMRRNADGTFTSDGSTGYTYPGDGRQTVETNLPIPAGSHTVALDLYSGRVQATQGAGRLLAADHVFDDGETGSGGQPADWDLDLDVTVSDPVKQAPSPRGDDGGSSSSGGSSGGGSPSGGGDDDPGDRDYPPGLSFDGRGVIRPDGKGVEVYARNETGKELSGTLRLQVGSKRFKVDRESEFDYHSSEDFVVPFGGKAARKVMRTGSVKAKLVASMGGVKKTYPIKVIRGGARGYDGTYRGKGPVTIVVQNGVITAVDEPMNTFCSQTGRFVMRSMSTGLGFPALVKKDGSFDHKASLSADSYTYRGKLRPHGRSKGYFSLWYSTFDSDPVSGNFRAISCMQASNWTAKRAK